MITYIKFWLAAKIAVGIWSIAKIVFILLLIVLIAYISSGRNK